MFLKSPNSKLKNSLNFDICIYIHTHIPHVQLHTICIYTQYHLTENLLMQIFTFIFAPLKVNKTFE